MTRALRILGLAAGLAIGASFAGGSAEGQTATTPSATPQRPSVSFGASTVPARGWELESGGLVTDGSSALPLFLKYGLTGRTELELGVDAVRQVEAADGTTSSVGDLFLGVRSRVLENDRGALAFAAWVKPPTAIDGVGSGELDAGVVGIYSTSVAGLGLDTNLWLSGLGQEDGSTLGQLQAVATLGLPGAGCWSPFVEVAWQTTASSGDGGFADAGVACAVLPHSVLDVAVGGGWSDGYPDWSFTAGWTLLLGQQR